MDSAFTPLLRERDSHPHEYLVHQRKNPKVHRHIFMFLGLPYELVTHIRL